MLFKSELTKRQKLKLEFFSLALEFLSIGKMSQSLGFKNPTPPPPQEKKFKLRTMHYYSGQFLRNI